jgi:flagellar hook-basal body complex protein FliE
MSSSQFMAQDLLKGNYGVFPKMPSVPGHNNLTGYVSHNEGIGGASFGSTINSMINRANQTMSTPDHLAIEAVNTGNVDIHEVMIAIGKADVAFKLITAVTQKVVGAFDKLTSLQV